MKIIAAVDRSDYADRVIEFTRRVAEGRQAEVLLIRGKPAPTIVREEVVRSARCPVLVVPLREDTGTG